MKLFSQLKVIHPQAPVVPRQTALLMKVYPPKVLVGKPQK